MKKTILFILTLNSISLWAQTSTQITVTSQNITIPGILTVQTWQSENPDSKFDFPKLYYAFAKGDDIVIDLNISNKKGTQILEVSEYSTKSIAYSNNSFQELSAVHIHVPKTGIYQFELATNHLLDRQARITINRIPANDASKDFNHNVGWKSKKDTVYSTKEESIKTKSIYEPISIQTPISYYINSVTNLTGTTRVSFPVELPENTVEWYYSFAATRNKADIERTKANMKLLSDISKAIDKTGTTAFAIDLLSKPPGSDYCDVFLVTQESNSAFIQKTEFRHYPDVSRQNLMSGVIKVKSCCNSGKYYLGFRNNDMSYGVEVFVEVVAITRNDVYENKIVKTPIKYIETKEPYILD